MLIFLTIFFFFVSILQENRDQAVDLVSIVYCTRPSLPCLQLTEGTSTTLFSPLFLIIGLQQDRTGSHFDWGNCHWGQAAGRCPRDHCKPCQGKWETVGYNWTIVLSILVSLFICEVLQWIVTRQVFSFVRCLSQAWYFVLFVLYMRKTWHVVQKFKFLKIWPFMVWSLVDPNCAFVVVVGTWFLQASFPGHYTKWLGMSLDSYMYQPYGCYFHTGQYQDLGPHRRQTRYSLAGCR